MHVLIVESRRALADLWRRHLQRQDVHVTIATTQQEAIDNLVKDSFDVVILDLVLDDGGALGVADVTSYRQPQARVIFVTNTSFFSDGSIFQHSPNACAYLPSATPPEDLAVMVEHYARAG